MPQTPLNARTRRVLTIGIAGAIIFAGGCQTASKAPPPPASRPALKSEHELKQEREALIATGAVVTTTAPSIGVRSAPTPSPASAPVRPAAGAIEPDILLINSDALSAAEVIYSLRDEIIKTRKEHTAVGAREKLTRLIRDATQREIGAILIYHEAVGKISEEQQKVLEDMVKRAIRGETDARFDGSSARLEAHLKENGLSMEKLRKMIERDMVVRQYAREKFQPQVVVRRDELLEYYQQNIDKYSTAETRELYLIELPFAKLLPEGERWATAPAAQQAQARLRATRRAREAHEALQAGRPFEDVAREYSLGGGAVDGGRFGAIGKPLQPPLDAVSKRIFAGSPGDYTEPVETVDGWYIARCGKVNAAQVRSFQDSQNEIRAQLLEQRFSRLTTDYFVKLAQKATFSSFDAFIEAALKQAEALPLD